MKLIKKHSIGGIAEAVDSQLDKLGTYGKLGVLVIDPTGISGWKDFEDALTDFLKSGTFGSAAGLVLAGLGAMPMIGGLGRVGKVGKELDKASDASKLISKSRKLFDEDIYRRLIDPNDKNIMTIASVFDTKQLREAERIIDLEIQKVYKWCESKQLTQVPKKMQDKIDKLAKKKKDLSYVKPNGMSMMQQKYERELEKVIKYISEHEGTPYTEQLKRNIPLLQDLIKGYKEARLQLWQEMKQNLV